MPAKPSYQEYANGDEFWNKAYDVSRKLDPIDQIGNMFGFKNPIHGWAEGGYNAVTGGQHSNVNRVRFGGNVFLDQMSDADKQDLYASMSPDELAQVGRMTDKDQLNWLMAKRQQNVAARARGADPTWQDPEEAAANAEKKKQQTIDDQIQEFYQHMTGPLDENDPEVKQMMQYASRSANDEAKKRGLSGGIVASEAARQASQGTAALVAHRQALGAQALQMKGTRALGLANLAEQGRQFDMNQYANQQQQAAQGRQGMAAGLGGLIGGMYGGPAGAQIGYGLGGSVAGGQPTSLGDYGSKQTYRPYGGNRSSGG